MSSESETLGQIRESVTGYGSIWNEEGKTFFQPYNGKKVEITQQNINDVNSGRWITNNGREMSFDGARTIGGIIWSWGPCEKFEMYLASTGQL